MKEFELVKQCSRDEDGRGRKDEAGDRKATNMTFLSRGEGSLATKIFERHSKGNQLKSTGEVKKTGTNIFFFIPRRRRRTPPGLKEA